MAANDDLDKLLDKHQITDQTLEIINSAGFTTEERDNLYNQLKRPKTKVLLTLFNSVNQKKYNENYTNENDKQNDVVNQPLFQTLKPILGTALAYETYKYLEDIYPNINNPDTQQQYIKLLNTIPDDTKFNLIAATLKIACIFQYSKNIPEPYNNSDAYNDINIVISHTLPAIYSWGKTTKDVQMDICSQNKGNEDELMAKFPNNPLSYARILLYNEHTQKIENNHDAAKTSISGITQSVGGNSSLKKLQQFIDKSKNLSEIIYNTIGYRYLSDKQHHELFKDILISKKPKNNSIRKVLEYNTGAENG